MADREREIAGFLQSAGWADAKRAALAGDASPRRYERLTRQGSQECAVLMDAPASVDDNIGAFLKIAEFLSKNGFSAPRIIASDISTGHILMEDLGDALFSRVCNADQTRETDLYAASVDVLADLHSLKHLPELPPYDTSVYLRESNLMTEWYLPAATGQETSEALRGAFSELIKSVCDILQNDQSCIVLRDYHAENLLWLPEREGTSRVGLLDFQDALIGHPAYDLVSLLEDARRDTGAELQAAMLDRYLAGYAGDHEAFRTAFAVLGAQRNLKIIGIFARLCLRDGKRIYVDMIPRVWQHLLGDLNHPALKALRGFIERYVPAPNADTLQKIRAGAT